MHILFLELLQFLPMFLLGSNSLSSPTSAIITQHLFCFLSFAASSDVSEPQVLCPDFRYGVLFATIISWIPGSSVSFLTDATPGGAERFEYFRRVVDVPNPTKTSLLLNWDGLRNGDAWVALVTFLYLDFLDATGTLFTMARLVNENVPGMRLR